MTSNANGQFRVGAWCVDPTGGRILRDGEEVRLDPRTMRLLHCLAERPGEVVSVNQLLDAVWPDVTVAPDSVYQAVAQLRRLLSDDPRSPTYIATAPRQGYRLIAAVDRTQAAPVRAGGLSRRHAGAAAAILGGIGLLAAGLWTFGPLAPATRAEAPSPAPASIAVMPFLDLTDAMDHEPFADGMTEELIDKLSRDAGLRVAAPRATFGFKGKRATPAAVAQALGVAYVLDGSVRRSGERVRVAARLVRADSGFVIWSQSYNRPAGDLLWVQQDIASAVATALAARTRTGEVRRVSQP